MNNHPLVLNDWFSVDKGGGGGGTGFNIGEEWIVVKVPKSNSWKACAVGWLRETARASLADALAPRLLVYSAIGGSSGTFNWLAALVMRQYLLPYLI